MAVKPIRNSVRSLMVCFLYIFCTLFFISCTSKERFEKGKYDQDLEIHNLPVGAYKECEAYTCTVLLPSRKIIRTRKKVGEYTPEVEVLVRGNNLFALFRYSNPACYAIDGWSSAEVHFEFANFHPEIDKQYTLPQQQIKIFYRAENSDLPTIYDHNDLTGKIIFHEYSERKVRFSLFLEPAYYANDPERSGKYPLLNFSDLEFKAFTEKFYENDDYKPWAE